MFFERHGGGERAILVHLEGQDPEAREDPQEFQDLAASAGAETVAFVNVARHQPTAKFLIGSGKVEELHDLVHAEKADLVIFNHTLTPSQERNLERAFECRVIDRTGLILDIFAQRARTHEGKLQVELAQLEHMSTRLVRGWTHLERQKGGIGMRGPGETQLETDRRLLRVRLRQIKARLEKVRSQREQARRGRRRADIPSVSLVGYTNAGKSTLFNAVTQAHVYAADQLFATLDPTLRRLELADLGPIVLADTVGFIRHLPHKLVEAFRATLEESSNSDLLLHVIDAHEPERQAQIEQVLAVLGEIGAKDLPILEVYNKVDLLENVEPQIQRGEDGKPQRVWLSAQDSKGLELLEQAIAELLAEDLFVATLRLPQQLGRLRAQFFAIGAVQGEEHDETGQSLLAVRIPRAELNRLVSREGMEPDAFVEQHTLQ
ncbi:MULTISPECIES: ribosome rescue GTPase HflX [unclassified Pseudomonas]|uniref:ribosome rescue GTPase HflX n=1 Tax=unclassified Pseudomonas TaxID=196821 RepID=UPI000BDDEE54|nr:MULTISPECIES: ribosome rescue GTPase HflX [unclassified Pseudomonas]PVZ09695.1 GTP-binding protein HflX [Pseudomonas sp. URIL14HWK12:I12]PVZ21549.1 GTP-binding protein HflX [Pseudomonas sp. URIL14HWK12:I10]PVZ30270.1 GTP-binding protein HflX [Pseudomonas sp. URIL14HWK12:I11]SNZ18791.1 GTP-binding protein HflX [Pseudomonas sp. URIL14HWK12:I9]